MAVARGLLIGFDASVAMLALGVLLRRDVSPLELLTTLLAAALKARGVADAPAALAARAGMAAFVHATVAWLEDPAVGLGERLDLADRDMHTLLTRAPRLGRPEPDRG